MGVARSIVGRIYVDAKVEGRYGREDSFMGFSHITQLDEKVSCSISLKVFSQQPEDLKSNMGNTSFGES